MQKVADELTNLIRLSDWLLQIEDETASEKPEPNKWSKKEIIGHLIDSAANNHQRFVRLQFTPSLDLPSYEQEKWVETQRYRNRSWPELIDLWTAYNRHLLHLVENVDQRSLKNTWNTASGPKTLEFLLSDYIAHLRHHLEQVLGDI